MYKISVIVPVYNVEKYVRKCLNSIFEQTFGDYEVIIVNDGSTDSSMTIVNQVVNEKKNVSIINKLNEGLPQARRTGVANASGEYIVFVDSDDWIEPGMLEIMYEKMKQSNADIVCCGVILEDNKGKTIYVQGSAKEQSGTCKDALYGVHSRTTVYPYMWNKMFKKKIIKEHYFPAGHFVGEDYCTLIPILENIDKFVMLSDVLYHYVQHGENMTKAGYGESYKLAYENYKDKCEYLIQKYPELDREITNYHLLEKMAILNAMIRNQKFDFDVRKKILTYVRKNFINYIFTSHDRLLYKVSSIFIALNWKIYQKVYIWVN